MGQAVPSQIDENMRRVVLEVHDSYQPPLVNRCLGCFAGPVDGARGNDRFGGEGVYPEQGEGRKR